MTLVCIWRQWSSEKLRSLPKAAQRRWDWAGLWTQMWVPTMSAPVSPGPHGPLDLAAPPSSVELGPLIPGRLRDHLYWKGTAEVTGCDFWGSGMLIPGAQLPCSEEAPAARESPTWRGPKAPGPQPWLCSQSRGWGCHLGSGSSSPNCLDMAEMNCPRQDLLEFLIHKTVSKRKGLLEATMYLSGLLCSQGWLKQK